MYLRTTGVEEADVMGEQFSERTAHPAPECMSVHLCVFMGTVQCSSVDLQKGLVNAAWERCRKKPPVERVIKDR